MYILIDVAGAATLLEPDVFTAFKLVSRVSPDALPGVLSQVAAIKDEGHVWVSQKWLREQGAGFGSEWLEKLDGMTRYAASKGWLQEETDALLAHIEFE